MYIRHGFAKKYLPPTAYSIERILDFRCIEQEPKPTEDGEPPAYWPSSGHLVVEDLCVRYSEGQLDLL